MSKPTIFIVRGHTPTCECRIDDCFVEVEEPVYRISSFVSGSPYWTGETTDALRLLLEGGYLVEIGGDDE